MEIIGKVKVLCDLVQGETAAGTWSRRDVVVSTIGDDSRDICLSFFGDRKVDKLREVKPGDIVQVYATIRSKTTDNVRWFTTVDASSVTVLQRQEERPPLQEN